MFSVIVSVIDYRRVMFMCKLNVNVMFSVIVDVM